MLMHVMLRITGLSLILFALIFGVFRSIVAKDDKNFSQFPGFFDYFAANPPSDLLPGPADRALLERHRPRIFLPPGHEGPVSFYDDYIAHGVLTAGDGTTISANVSQAILNAHKNDPQVTFSYIPQQAAGKPTPTILGRIERAKLDLGEGEKQYVFLSYHAVFRRSGLPAGLRAWQELPLGLVADLNDWHQLDHYTAATIVLDTAVDEPIAMMLQHHNYHRTYLFGEGAQLPSDGRPLIDVAVRSNELYPHLEGKQRRRAASFIDPSSWRYLMGITGWKLTGVDDITNPQREIAYKLELLRPSDAFYTFMGFLGERRILPGRDGPPGANYKTLPRFMPLRTQVLLGYWREGNGNDIDTLRRAFRDDDGYHAFVSAQAAVWKANLMCLRRWKQACALQ